MSEVVHLHYIPAKLSGEIDVVGGEALVALNGLYVLYFEARVVKGHLLRRPQAAEVCGA